MVRDLDLNIDYPSLVAWWAGWDLPPIPREELPASGFLSFVGEEPIAAAFLVMTNAPYAFVTTFVSSPSSGWKEREVAIKQLLNHISEFAKNIGYKRLIILPEKDRLKNKIVSSGFTQCPNRVYLCIKEF